MRPGFGFRFTRPRAPSRRAAAILATLSLTACAPGSSDEPFRPVAVGAPVPGYTVRTIAGDTARIAPGQPLTLLHAWATWCAPCEKEFPDLQALQRDYGSRGLRIVAVSVDEGGDEPVREFVSRKGATFPVGRDPEGSIRRLYQGIGVPESYLISAEGTLILRHFGALPEGAASMRGAIERALSAAQARADSAPIRRITA